MSILVVTDHEFLFQKFKELVDRGNFTKEDIDYRFTEIDENIIQKFHEDKVIKPINMKENPELIAKKYRLIISLHCKQVFPEILVKKTRCINVHPGYNPYNRGWFPHVFSISNSLPAGVTIHEMDEQLDHGAIIVQESIHIEPWETSKDVYDKILELEVELLKENLENIIKGNYDKKTPPIEGNLNTKADFNDFCHLDLNKEYTMKEFINLLRALTHGDYKNAYFYDENGNKIWVKIQLEKDN